MIIRYGSWEGQGHGYWLIIDPRTRVVHYEFKTKGDAFKCARLAFDLPGDNLEQSTIAKGMEIMKWHKDGYDWRSKDGRFEIYETFGTYTLHDIVDGVKIEYFDTLKQAKEAAESILGY